jgi:general secretion pathway protein D
MKTSQTSEDMARLLAVCVAAVLLGGVTAAQAQVINNPVQPSAITVLEQQVEVGPVLDVVPCVLSDGYTINLTLIPSLTEFAGYDTKSIPVPSVANVVLLPNLLPKFTVRQVVTTVNIWDNQTIVLGGLISSSVQSTSEKIPMLGDLPMVGRLFQSQTKTSSKKNLMIFVTATIVDPAGNRMHSDDELPFAQSTIPPQQPGVDVQPANVGGAPLR